MGEDEPDIVDPDAVPRPADYDSGPADPPRPPEQAGGIRYAESEIVIERRDDNKA